MKDLTPEERQKIIDLNNMVAANWSHMKKHSEFIALAPTISNDTKTANFSGSPDNADKSGLLPEFAKEREEAAFNDIRRLTIKEAIKTSLTGYIEKRNGQIKAAKNAIKRRFDFRQHDAK